MDYADVKLAESPLGRARVVVDAAVNEISERWDELVRSDDHAHRGLNDYESLELERDHASRSWVLVVEYQDSPWTPADVIEDLLRDVLAKHGVARVEVRRWVVDSADVVDG